MTVIYITRVDTRDAEGPNGAPGPDAIYKASVNGEALVANQHGGLWFTDFRRAESAIRRQVRINPSVKIEWVPQYDSIVGLELDEPCGYVGQVDR